MQKKSLISSALTAGLIAAGSAHAACGGKSVKNGIKCEGVATKWVNDCGANGHECASHATKNFDSKEWLKMTKADCDAVKSALKNPAVKAYVERIQKGTVVATKRGKKF